MKCQQHETHCSQGVRGYAVWYLLFVCYFIFVYLSSLLVYVIWNKITSDQLSLTQPWCFFGENLRHFSAFYLHNFCSIYIYTRPGGISKWRVTGRQLHITTSVVVLIALCLSCTTYKGESLIVKGKNYRSVFKYTTVGSAFPLPSHSSISSMSLYRVGIR